MCGIVGAYSGQQPIEELESLIAKAVNVLAHRGPDFSSFRTMNNICMGHSRLSIIDTSESGHQPFYNDRSLLSFNGEIYNYKLLQNSFLSDTQKLKSTSDTEVLFLLLSHLGVEKTLAALNGMFAFSYYSTQDQALYLCRDRYGIKPLYWIQRNDKLFWASEIKALREMTTIEVDHLRAMNSIAMPPEMSCSSTLFRDVNQVPPGSYLKLQPDGKPEIIKYYDLTDDVDRDYYNELDMLDFANIKKHFTGLMSDSIQSMLMSDVPVGSFVSGGLDSSLIPSITSLK